MRALKSDKSLLMEDNKKIRNDWWNRVLSVIVRSEYDNWQYINQIVKGK